MADVVYRVVVDYSASGNLSSTLDTANKKTSDLNKAMTSVLDTMMSSGGGIVSAFQQAVEHAGTLAMTVAKIAGAGGLAAATYGVVKLNNELEKSTIGIGATLTAFGVTGSLPQGLEVSKQLLGQMRKDAAALPGEFGDLKEFFSMGLSAGLQSGKAPLALEKMAANAMATAAALEVPMEQAAREYAMLLGGRADAHNVFGAKLGLTGDSAEKFNKEDAGKRADDLSARLAKFSPAIDAYSKSWDGLSSTLRDNIKNFIRLATERPFERIKQTLSSINDWFGSHQNNVERWAQIIGDGLTSAWSKGIDLIQQWGPSVIQFAKDLKNELSVIWDRFAPALKQAGDALAGALGNGTALKDIGKILELYAGSKVMGFDSGIGKGLGMAMGAPLGPGGAAAGGALGSIGGVGMLGGAPGVALEKALEVGLLGAMKDHPKETGEALGRLAAASQRLVDMFDTQVMPTLERFAVGTINNLADGLTALGNAIDIIQHPFESLITYSESLARSMGTFGDVVADQIARFKGPKLNPEAQGDDVDRYKPLSGFNRAMGSTVLAQNEEAKQALKGIAASSNKPIHVKVEMVVNSNQDANRVARMVFDEFEAQKRFPRQSSSVPDWSRSSP